MIIVCTHDFGLKMKAARKANNIALEIPIAVISKIPIANPNIPFLQPPSSLHALKNDQN